MCSIYCEWQYESKLLKWTISYIIWEGKVIEGKTSKKAKENQKFSDCWEVDVLVQQFFSREWFPEKFHSKIWLRMLSLCGQPVTGKVNKVRKNCPWKKRKVSLMTMLKNH